MNGSDPPSSRTTFLRLRPATSATAAPARSLPVTDTPDDPRVGDHVRDLVVGGEHVDVGVFRQAGVVEDLLHRQRRLRALRCVLQNDRVADHQVRGREPGDLVVGEVPRHDAEQRADRLLADQRRAPGPRAERGVLQQRRALVGVVLVDADHQHDLALGLPDGLAHLPGDQRGQLVAPLLVQLGHPQQDLGPLVLGRGPPGLVGAIGALQDLLDLGVGGGVEFPLGLVRGRVDDLVLAHADVPSDSLTADVPPASSPRLLPVAELALRASCQFPP